jgi:hypothetical protein
LAMLLSSSGVMAPLFEPDFFGFFLLGGQG